MNKIIQLNFDNFKIDYYHGVFHNNGEKLNLRPKELALLKFLVQRSMELVTKDQIINEVWNGNPTSDESIARCISIIKSQLRSASPGAEQLIKTEYSRGYRFVANVTIVRDRRLQTSKNRGNINPTSIGEIASKDILTCHPRTTVLEVARLLSSSKKSSILILNQLKPVGIWTEADALHLNITNQDSLQVKIKDVMTSPIMTIEEWKPITDAVVVMLNNNIRHLVVVDKLGNAIGVVTQSDIVHCQGAEAFITVKDVKSAAYRRPLIITKNLPVAEIVFQMRLNHTDILIIKLNEKEVFSFTEHDVIGLIANQCLDKYIADLEITPLVTINQDTSLLVARQLMDIKKIKHLAVVDNNAEIIKVLGLSDILADLEYSYVHLMEEMLDHNDKSISIINDNTQLLTQAIQQTAGMVIITDSDGDIVFVNGSFEKVTGYIFADIKGKNPRFLNSNTLPKSVFRQMWQTVKSGKTWKGELCNKKKSGELYWVLSSVSPIVNDNNDIQHFIAVEEDISA